MKYINLFFLALLLTLFACNDAAPKKESDNTVGAVVPGIKEEAVSYGTDSVKLTGFVAYDSSVTTKLPVVLVIHEWWGLNDYVKSRVKQLASLGYLAIAVDMYGDGKMGNDPGEAEKLSTPFYKDPALAKNRFDAALTKIKSYPQADTSKLAAIGYCFGGAMVLNMAKLGENLNGVVSFHGNLAGVPADKNLLKAKILVCHAADDQFVKPEEIAAFKKQMDSIKADYTFKVYAGATHAFSNPDATALGEKFKIPIGYNAAADSASWNEMKMFFGKIFK